MTTRLRWRVHGHEWQQHLHGNCPGQLRAKDTNSVAVNLPAPVAYIYDLNGNLTSDGTRGFEYDDENELIRVPVTNS